MSTYCRLQPPVLGAWSPKEREEQLSLLSSRASTVKSLNASTCGLGGGLEGAAGAAGVDAFAGFCKIAGTLPNLVNLNLTGNRLTDDDMDTLCQEVLGFYLPNLTSVSLGGNGLTSKGVETLAQHLVMHRSVTTLFLEDNPAIDDISPLIQMLGENGVLQLVHLKGTAVKATQISDLTDLLARNAAGNGPKAAAFVGVKSAGKG